MHVSLVVRPLPLVAALLATVFATLFASTLFAAGAVVRVPPAKYAGAPSAKAMVSDRLLPESAPRRLIVLATPTAADTAGLKAANALPAAASRSGRADPGKGQPLTIGFGRDVPAGDRELRGAALPWQPVAEGGYAARIDVSSEGAVALRVALAMPVSDPDVTVRFAGSAAGAPVFGPFPAIEVAEATAKFGVYWSPVLDGSTATIEIHAPPGVARERIAVRLTRVSHLAVAGAGLKFADPKRVTEIGRAGSCEIDVVCVTPPTQSLRDAADSVAQIVFTLDDGRTGLCTATMLNNSVTDFQPYLYAAGHCIDRQSVAATINTYWFFDAVACGSLQVPPYVLVTGGAMLLARSQDADWALVRLNRAPPAGTVFSAWSADPVPPTAIGTTIHHAEGDLKKWTQGSAVGLVENVDLDFHAFFQQMIWNQGSTEPGSSGAGLFTFYQPGGYYELRGGLSAGTASCSNRSGYDLFTRMEVALPLLRQYLTPDAANPTGLVPAVEFYAKTLDHYFLSTNPVEISVLDTGTIPGWVRTGLRFLAYSNPALAPAGANPVCRFYLRPGYGDSHFYSGDPAECAETARRFGAAWIYESPNVFYIQLPNAQTGACPANTHPLWRFFNLVTTNHRYTAEIVLRDQLRANPLWVPEGYGPDAVIMCSPNG